MARVLISDADGRRSQMEHGAQFVCMITVFACGAGDGNRTRTVSLGRVLIPPCFRVLQRYWWPQLAPGDPYRPGLVARAWPASLASPIEDRALAETSWTRIPDLTECLTTEDVQRHFPLSPPVSR